MSRITTVILLFLFAAGAAVGTTALVIPRLEALQLNEASRGLLQSARLLQELDLSEQARLTAKLEGLAARQTLAELLQEGLPGGAIANEAWLQRLGGEVNGLTAAVSEVAPVRDFVILDSKGALLFVGTGKNPAGDPSVQRAVLRATQGERGVFWTLDNQALLRVITVPVASGGLLRGILLATFPLQGALANRGTELNPLGAPGAKAEQGVEFVYINAKQVLLGELTDAGREATQLVVEQAKEEISRLVDGKRLDPRLLETPNGRWLVVGVAVSAEGAKGLAVLVLRDVGVLRKPLTELAWMMLGLGGIIFAVFVTVVVVFGGRISRGLRGLLHDAHRIAAGAAAKFEEAGPASIRTLARALNQIGAPPAPAAPEAPPPKAEAIAEPAGEPASAVPGAEELDREEEESVDEAFDSGAAHPVIDGADDEDAADLAREHDRTMKEHSVPPPLPFSDPMQELSKEPSTESDEFKVPIPGGLEAPEPTPPVAAAPAAGLELLGGGAVNGEDQEDRTSPVKDYETLQREQERLRDDLLARGDFSSGETPPKPPSLEPSTLAIPADQLQELAAKIDSEPAGEGNREAEAGAEPEGATVVGDSQQFHLERYYRDTYEEFLRAKEEVGEKVVKLSFERFVQKLKQQEETLKVKHGCASVRFEVAVRNNQVALRPRIIRE